MCLRYKKKINKSWVKELKKVLTYFESLHIRFVLKCNRWNFCLRRKQLHNCKSSKSSHNHANGMLLSCCQNFLNIFQQQKLSSIDISVRWKLRDPWCLKLSGYLYISKIYKVVVWLFFSGLIVLFKLISLVRTKKLESKPYISCLK